MAYRFARIKYFVIFDIFIGLSFGASATPPKLCPGITPLPDAQISSLLEDLNAGKKVDSSTLAQALNGTQTTLRAEAASVLGNSGKEAIPYLIDALSDDSSHVGANYSEAGMYTTRYRANESLKKLTRKDFGFIWDSAEIKRRAAIGRWINWYQTTSGPEYHCILQ